ncbi:hypothetical protein HD553DRAFT_324835 [Filobasidium floriforme]|uniref:uncharacterized protein n=1 Tax=Filobasidium floriforme TaxID=5210 RepID=UPI001E8D3299|nr:uncharacterized protein HD553DRAFT_324835 [Filobasidium floriforme]KAH8082536.1 hypothetical protein HD553DRAFT_324835 [Filobasidium floriforme]
MSFDGQSRSEQTPDVSANTSRDLTSLTAAEMKDLTVDQLAAWYDITIHHAAQLALSAPFVELLYAAYAGLANSTVEIPQEDVGGEVQEKSKFFQRYDEWEKRLMDESRGAIYLNREDKMRLGNAFESIASPGQDWSFDNHKALRDHINTVYWSIIAEPCHGTRRRSLATAYYGLAQIDDSHTTKVGRYPVTLCVSCGLIETLDQRISSKSLSEQDEILYQTTSRLTNSLTMPPEDCDRATTMSIRDQDGSRQEGPSHVESEVDVRTLSGTQVDGSRIRPLTPSTPEPRSVNSAYNNSVTTLEAPIPQRTGSISEILECLTAAAEMYAPKEETFVEPVKKETFVERLYAAYTERKEQGSFEGHPSEGENSHAMRNFLLNFLRFEFDRKAEGLASVLPFPFCDHLLILAHAFVAIAEPAQGWSRQEHDEFCQLSSL